MQNIKTIGLLMLFACLLLATGFATQKSGFWFELDSQIFYFFNHLMAKSNALTQFIALINHRLFDVISFITMGLVYYAYYRHQSQEGKRRMIAIGIVMLLCAVALKQIGRLLPIDHASPTLFFDDAFRVSEHSMIPTKDASGDSFPSDHGMFLMIFAAFMLRYFGMKTLKITVPIVILFSLPRIIIGAHWFSDIYVGSLFMVCFVLSWFLLSGLSNFCIDKIQSLIPKRFWSNK